MPLIGKPMTATLSLAPPPPPVPIPQALDRPLPRLRWPRLWSQRRALLECQHERIEGLLDRLIHRHAQPGQAGPGEPFPSHHAACARLVRALGLHLRLEERWLRDAGALCPGHRAAHGLAAALARQGLERSAAAPAERLAWLLELRHWFEQHRNGPDAMAYARAGQRTGSTPAIAPR